MHKCFSVKLKPILMKLMIYDPTKVAYHVSLAAAATKTVHTVLGFDCGLFGCDLYTN